MSGNNLVAQKQWEQGNIQIPCGRGGLSNNKKKKIHYQTLKSNNFCVLTWYTIFVVIFFSSDIDLQEQVEGSLIMPPTYETVVSRAQLALVSIRY